MAGRILPIALATVAGVSIGIATFDGELRTQQKKRLQKEYEQELASIASIDEKVPTKGTDQLASQSAPQPEANRPSKLASALGMWAWKKSNNQQDQKPVSKER